MKRNCDYCGKEYDADPKRLKFGRQKFCSRGCSYKHRAKILTKLKIYNCSNCGKEIKRSPSTIKSDLIFCDIHCKAEAMGKKIIKSARLGTGKPKNILKQYYKRKYFKYRNYDIKNKLETINMGSNNFADLFTDKSCFYCGDTNNLGLDRIDNKKGHTLDNVVYCCELCNMTRGDRFNIEEFKLIGEIINGIKKNRSIGRV